MTMPNVVVGDDTRAFWRTDDGLYADSFRVCSQHEWRDPHLPCPWPHCGSDTVGRWPLYVTYRCAYLERDGDYDAIQFGEKATYIAEKRGDRYVWVKYAPVEEGDIRG